MFNSQTKLRFLNAVMLIGSFSVWGMENIIFPFEIYSLNVDLSKFYNVRVKWRSFSFEYENSIGTKDFKVHVQKSIIVRKQASSHM